MAQIEHAFVGVTTRDTHTGDTNFTAVTGASLASDWSGATASSGAGFEAGKKYLLFVTAQVDISALSSLVNVRVVHGATAFADSNMNWQCATTIGHRMVYAWWTIWTAVATETITVEFNTANSANTVGIDQIGIFVVNLADDLAENTDWFYAEDTGPDTISTTPIDGASITFTPGEASDWLVLSLTCHDFVTTGAELTSNIDRSGEASSTLPRLIQRHPIGNAQMPFALGRVFALTAVSNTFKEVSVTDIVATNKREQSQIFALNLNKFKDHVSAANSYTAGPTALSAANYTELKSVSITPTVQSNLWIGTSFLYDLQNTTREIEWRIQYDNSDQPASQTTDNYQFISFTESNAEDTECLITMVANATTAAHTIDLDGSADSAAGAPEVESMTIWAVTMELAAAAEGITRTATAIAVAFSVIDATRVMGVLNKAATSIAAAFSIVDPTRVMSVLTKVQTVIAAAFVVTTASRVMNPLVKAIAAISAMFTTDTLTEVVMNPGVITRTFSILTPTRVSTYLRTLATTTVGIVTLTTGLVFSRVLDVIAIGLASLTKLNIWARTLVTVNVGVAGLTTLSTYFRTLAPVAVGVAGLTRIATYLRTLAITAVGVVALTTGLVFNKALDAVAAGVAVLAKALAFSVTLATTAIGVATLNKLITYMVTLNAAATGLATFSRTVLYNITLGAIAIGVAVLSRVATYLRTLVAISVGIVELVIALAFNTTLAVGAIGLAGLTTLVKFSQALAGVAAGLVNLVSEFIPGSGEGGGMSGGLIGALVNLLSRRRR